MMRNAQFIQMGIIVGAILLFWGCQESPQQELEEAQQVIEQARQAGAGTQFLGQAEDTVKKAQEAIHAQEEQWALLRDYNSAKELLNQAKKEALQAKTDAIQAQTAAPVVDDKEKSEGLAATAEAQSALDEAKNLLATAPTGKDTTAAFLAMEGNLQSAESILDEISRQDDQQDYQKIKAQAQRAKELAVQVSQQVQQALSKTK